MHTICKPKSSTIQSLYEKFEYLAANYAKQVFHYEKLGFEYEDLLQEFKVKIYTSIVAYGERWQKFKSTGRYKPVPIKIYIQSALNNKRKDFVRQIDGSPFTTISVEQDGFDYALCNSCTSNIVANGSKVVCELNGVNLISNLDADRSRCFILYLRGFGIGKLQSMFRHKFSAREVINNQVLLLQERKSELRENHRQSFITYNVEQD